MTKPLLLDPPAVAMVPGIHMVIGLSQATFTMPVQIPQFVARPYPSNSQLWSIFEPGRLPEEEEDKGRGKQGSKIYKKNKV